MVTSIARVADATRKGILLGAVAGCVYGPLALLGITLLENRGLTPALGLGLVYLVPAGLIGALLGGIGGAGTGILAGLFTELAGRPFTATAWWLGCGAAGGLLAAWLVQQDLNPWWHGIPALIGAGCGAAFGRWLQLRSRETAPQDNRSRGRGARLSR